MGAFEPSVLERRLGDDAPAAEAVARVRRPLGQTHCPQLEAGIRQLLTLPPDPRYSVHTARIADAGPVAFWARLSIRQLSTSSELSLALADHPDQARALLIQPR